MSDPNATGGYLAAGRCKNLRGRTKEISEGLQIAKPEFLARFQATAFRPFVPGVDREDMGLSFRGGEKAVCDQACRLLKGCGRVTNHYRIHDMGCRLVPAGVGVGTRRIVPVDGRVGKIGYRVTGQRMIKKREVSVTAPVVVGDGKRVLIQRPVMDPRVSGQAVEREITAEPRPVGRRPAAG